MLCISCAPSSIFLLLINASTPSYWPNKYHISTHTALYWPSTTKYQPVKPHTDPVSPITKLYRLLPTKYHQISTISSPYWPSITPYWPSTISTMTSKYLNVRLSFVDLRWAQLNFSLVFVTFFEADVWFRLGAQGLVKILKLKFGQYFEAGAYLRFDKFWKYNWERR